MSESSGEVPTTWQLAERLYYSFPDDEFAAQYRQEMGDELAGLVIKLSEQSREEFIEAEGPRKEAIERFQAEPYPSILIERNPSETPIVVLSLHEDLGNEEVGLKATPTIPLIEVLTSENANGIRYDREWEGDQFEILERNNIQIVTLDERFYEVVGSTEIGGDRIMVDTLSEKTVISVFGLNEEDHGGAIVVLAYDSWSQHTLSALIQEVEERIGRPPLILKKLRHEDRQHNETEYWKVTENVEIPAGKDRATLQEMIDRLMAWVEIEQSGAE